MLKDISASRLQMLIGQGVASVIMLWLTAQRLMSEEYMALYLLASGGVYGYSKRQERMVELETIRKEGTGAVDLR